MSFNLLNPQPHGLGDIVQNVSPGNLGQPYTNNSGATISKGYIAAINMTDTTATLTNLISCGANANAQQWPLVVALADVASGANSTAFAPMGRVSAFVASGVTKGSLVSPGTTSATGGNLMIAYVTTGTMSCGRLLSGTPDGATTLVDVAFQGNGDKRWGSGIEGAGTGLTPG